MGSGKTAVARSLAGRLNVTMLDLDEIITTKERRTPAQIIVEDGEREFRNHETAALTEVLQTAGGKVISLGGGAWIQETNRTLISEHAGVTVWLDASFATCWQRIQTSHEDRPLGRTEEEARTLYERRRPFYELANIHLRVGKETAPDLAARLELLLAHHLNT
jgi:shikimate kinase